MTKNTKNGLSIVIMGLLSIATAYYITHYSENTLKQELSDFAVKDTAAVDCIFLSDKDGHKLLLERKAVNYWVMNKTEAARMDVVKTLLETITQIRVKAPVGRASFNTVVKRIAVKSTKVEIYAHGEKIKTYYVGGTTDDFLGNYMLMEKSAAPFIVHIPGFDGYLYPRYYAMPELWRSTRIISLKANDIASVSYQHFKDTLQSWSLNVTASGFTLKDYKGRSIPEFDTLKVREYLTRFNQVNCEGYVKEIEPWRKDSILHSPPLLQFVIKDVNGKSTKLEGFTKKMMTDVTDMNGKKMDIDVDRFYGRLQGNNKDLLLLQYFVFDPLLVSVDFFAPQTRHFVKK